MKVCAVLAHVELIGLTEAVIGFFSISDFVSWVLQACISALVYGLGDLTAQTYEGRAMGDLDLVRAFRSSLCGFLVLGPLAHHFYLNLDRLFMYIKVGLRPSSEAL